MAFPRLIPVPDSPPHSAKPSTEMVLDDTGHTSESFDPKCAPPQVPRCESANYDQLPYDQLHDLHKQRGYQQQAAKAVLKTRLVAVDAVGRRPPGGAEADMDTTPSVLGERT